MTPCIPWTKCKSDEGYGYIRRNHRTLKAHRVAYCDHHGLSIDEIAGKVVRHKCDNPSCINPLHLELGTNADNVHDRTVRLRSWAKLSAEDIPVIRYWIDAGFSMTSIGDAFGVSRKQIANIRCGKHWNHV